MGILSFCNYQDGSTPPTNSRCSIFRSSSPLFCSRSRSRKRAPICPVQEEGKVNHQGRKPIRDCTFIYTPTDLFGCCRRAKPSQILTSLHSACRNTFGKSRMNPIKAQSSASKRNQVEAILHLLLRSVWATARKTRGSGAHPRWISLDCTTEYKCRNLPAP